MPKASDGFTHEQVKFTKMVRRLLMDILAGEVDELTTLSGTVSHKGYKATMAKTKEGIFIQVEQP